MNLFQKITTGILLSVAALLLTPSALAASPTSQLAVSVEAGQSFELALSIDSEAVKNYTSQIEIDFSPDVLEATDFEFASGWLPLTQTSYDVLDNETGSILKTAGYPNGTSGEHLFGTLHFTAKATGEALLTFTGDFLKMNNVERVIILDKVDDTLVDNFQPSNLDLKTETSDSEAPVAESVAEKNLQNQIIQLVFRAKGLDCCEAEIEQFAELNIAEFVSAFQDIRRHWAEVYIEILECLNIVSGRRSTNFVPNSSINRAEITKIAIEAFDIPLQPAAENPFTDVVENSWYALYVRTGFADDIITGYAVEDASKEFRPAQSVTRAEALKIILEAANLEDIDYYYSRQRLISSYRLFPDVTFDDWFAKYVGYARDKGIVSGNPDGTFQPNHPITRAEAAKIVVKVLGLKRES